VFPAPGRKPQLTTARCMSSNCAARAALDAHQLRRADQVNLTHRRIAVGVGGDDRTRRNEYVAGTHTYASRGIVTQEANAAVCPRRLPRTLIRLKESLIAELLHGSGPDNAYALR